MIMICIGINPRDQHEILKILIVSLHQMRQKLCELPKAFIKLQNFTQCFGFILCPNEWSHGIQTCH